MENRSTTKDEKSSLESMCDCFPTCARLLGRGVTCPSECVMCSDSIEDTLHALFTCPRSIQVWRATHFWADVEQALMDFATITYCFLFNCSLEPLEASKYFMTTSR
jgi:hypothetical protein